MKKVSRRALFALALALVLGIAFGLLGSFLVNLIYKKWVYKGKYAE